MSASWPGQVEETLLRGQTNKETNKLDCPPAASVREEKAIISKKKGVSEKRGYICGTLYVQDLFVFSLHVRAVVKEMKWDSNSCST